MVSDKELKKEMKKKASKDPDSYFPTESLRAAGFERYQCQKCKTHFWSARSPEKSKVCGDANCSGGFRFIGKSPAKNKMDYVQLWQKFSQMFKKKGYQPIKRYPVVARWRDDTDFVQASIYDFQPYVVTGEVEPPANPLVVPQFSLRFNDIDNVGITGAHYTGFVMIGQHAFMPPEKFDQEKYWQDINDWVLKGLGLPKEEVTYHEDAWAGGGNLGCSLEFFSRGLELGNQVYTMYEVDQAGKLRDLKLKVLDMGMGHERNAWFTMGTSTSYETTFPPVIKKLQEVTGVKIDADLMKKFLPYSSYLNIDEAEDINKQWRLVAKKVGLGTKELKELILPTAAMYSVAEHSRSLLVALADGALPSNTGGGYNLRVILRRALSFISKYEWNIDLAQLVEWHADYLKRIFPELKENLEEVKKILEVEEQKFNNSQQKAKQIVEKIVKKEKIVGEDLLNLYDNQGINPELIKEEARKKGKRIEIPDNFYAKVAELHEEREKAVEKKKVEELDLKGVEETKILYYDDYELVKFKGKVVKIIDNNIVLDQTAFYPTSGGQENDEGKLNGQKVVDVFKQGKIVIHLLEEAPKFKKGDEVKGEIDLEKRKQLAQHHTATHVINAAAKRVLGKHINQAGAKKTREKAHIDLTHYKSLTKEEEQEIENEANKIIKEKIPVYSKLIPRTEAEQTYGMSIYQGGAVPGKVLRIIEIPEVDVEACGGTHLKNTQEAEKVKIIKSTKISDAIVRVEFKAGQKAVEEEHKEKEIIDEVCQLLGAGTDQVVTAVEEIFQEWKKIKKKRKGKEVEIKKPSQLEYRKIPPTNKEQDYTKLLLKLTDFLRTQPDHLKNTLQRFMKELEEVV